MAAGMLEGQTQRRLQRSRIVVRVIAVAGSAPISHSDKGRLRAAAAGDKPTRLL